MEQLNNIIIHNVERRLLDTSVRGGTIFVKFSSWDDIFVNFPGRTWNQKQFARSANEIGITIYVKQAIALQDIVIETILGGGNSAQDPLLLKSLFVGLKTMSLSVTAKDPARWNIFIVPLQSFPYCAGITFQSGNLVLHYRSGTVNSKSFLGKVLLRIEWKFELNYAL